MEEVKRLEKNLTIKERGIETRNRHKSMRCVVITTKVVKNKLNKTQKEQIYGQFREAKWIYNSMLNQSNYGVDIFKLTYKDFESVCHLDKDKNKIIDKIQYLSKREIQSVISSIKNNIKSLSSSKKHGNNVGGLKFISEYKSIDLAQYVKSYRIVGKNKIKIDKVNGYIRVRGLSQLWNISDKYELANAKLINKPDGIYIAITVYIESSVKHEQTQEKALLGIDMGCETSLTLSNGEKINLEVKETERLKRLQRSLARCEKGSHNRMNVRRKLMAEYQHLSNKRDDMASKLLNYLKQYIVVMQDEQLASWQENGHGKKIAHGVLGRIKNELEKRSDTFIINKYVPTTKLCRNCGNTIEISQYDREFKCPHCNTVEDRDVHAAKNMVWLFANKKALCVERTEYSREDFYQKIRDIFAETNHETTKSLA